MTCHSIEAAPRQKTRNGGSASSSPSESLKARLVQEIEKMGASGGVWAIAVADAKTGKILADLNDDYLLLPASNRKIISTSMALRRLGPDYHFTTRLWACGKIEGSGILRGDLVLEAGGDPTMRPTFLNGRSGLGLFGDWAQKTRAVGITKISGDFTVDCSVYEEPSPMPPGWTWDQLCETYGTLPSALAINENHAVVTVRPGGEAGSPCRVESVPSTEEGLALDNQGRTINGGGRKTFRLERSTTRAALSILGDFPIGFAPETVTVPLPDPATVWAHAMGRALERNGITIEGKIRVSRRREAPKEASDKAKLVVEYRSPSLKRIVSWTNKESDNHCAEMLYLASGAGVLGVGSYTASQAVEKQFLGELGIDSSQILGQDGSGLSRTDGAAPRAMVKLLAAMESGPGSEEFRESLPISGEDGTLKYRMEKGLEGRVRAKTGTLRDVSGLSGYLMREDGRKLAFSMLANHFSIPVGVLRAKQDRICSILAQVDLP